MATILDTLKGVNAYPIPLRTFFEFAGRRGLNLEQEATQEVLNGADYNLVVADLLLWLSVAPAISQGGQSYSFTDEQRTQLRNRSTALHKDYGKDEAGTPKPIYGYKGNRL